MTYTPSSDRTHLWHRGTGFYTGKGLAILARIEGEEP